MKNITHVRKTDGYDNELTHTEHDLLDRESLANNILNTIVDTPTDWSINTGIYGPWGTGKTTLLNFIEIAAKEKGYLYISFNPTSYTDSNGMWAAFYSILLKELEKNGFDISNALPSVKWKTISLNISGKKYLVSGHKRQLVIYSRFQISPTQ
ncbi:MAG: hypothetical protein A3E85_03810 [Gammaproteobacteria bacterium RIFCSPHIGHO2_12_FULL_45_12]|nr:MAG: hypothetical protein A3E85_03810 [Gammaproteobacteria bacterium RIFCSPHIGHO2_12_FULL_45_12]